MALPCVALLLSLATPPVQAPDQPRAAAAETTGVRWLPLDDPEGERLPAALRALPALRARAYEDEAARLLLFARHLESESVVDAFMEDEAIVAAFDAFVPEEERFLELEEGEGIVFVSAWADGRVAALYAPGRSGEVVSIWVAGDDASADELASVAEAHLPLLRADVALPVGPRYEGLLFDHDLSFSLGGPDFDLQPVAEPRPRDRAYHDEVTDTNKDFSGAYWMQWKDAANDLTLSYQVIQIDASLGPKEAAVFYLAEQLQTFEQVDPANGDIPIELLHVDAARTNVVSSEEIARHYANNRNAPDKGVILETYIPRSPFARVTRLRWRDDPAAEAAFEAAEAEKEKAPGEVEDKTPHPDPPKGPERETVERVPLEPGPPEEVFALYVELRTYPRSRSETITRTAIAILQARAADSAVLERFFEQIDFRSSPRPHDPPLTGAAH